MSKRLRQISPLENAFRKYMNAHNLSWASVSKEVFGDISSAGQMFYRIDKYGHKCLIRVKRLVLWVFKHGATKEESIEILREYLLFSKDFSIIEKLSPTANRTIIDDCIQYLDLCCVFDRRESNFPSNCKSCYPKKKLIEEGD